MKICLFSDVHWSKNSSIIISRGQNYSTRLEYLIKSMNWVNDVAYKTNCDFMICAGDMMNTPEISDEEGTALGEIKWTKPCYFLCGNHESSTADLRFSSVKILENHGGTKERLVISEPWNLDDYDLGNTQIHFVPYIVESDRTALKDYLTNVDKSKKQIIISHNDIAGINYGVAVSTVGFNVKEIEENCDLYLNGHIHNSTWVSKKILNLGSFSGHNFTNDSNEYKYGIWILDTDTLKLDFIENPYSLNFYKIDVSSDADFEKLKHLKDQAVISVKCSAKYLVKVKELLDTLPNVLKYRLLLIREATTEEGAEVDISELMVDHLAKFSEMIYNILGHDKIVEEELNQICK